MAETGTRGEREREDEDKSLEGIDRRRFARTPQVGDDRPRLTEEREVEAAPAVVETAEVDMVLRAAWKGRGVAGLQGWW